MLPIIQDMERNPVSPHALQGGHLDSAVTGLWVCAGHRTQCVSLRQRLLDPAQSLRVAFPLRRVLRPFMRSMAHGSVNANLLFRVAVDDAACAASDSEQGALRVSFVPLETLSAAEQQRVRRLDLKVLSVATFKRNLQPMPDACRITKVPDGHSCLALLDEAHGIALQIGAQLTPQRRRAQSMDAVLGVGFDCSSRASWRKPRVYWVPHTAGNNDHHKKHNDAVRIWLLWPRGVSGSVRFYVGGVEAVCSERICIATPPSTTQSANSKSERILSALHRDLVSTRTQSVLLRQLDVAAPFVLDALAQLLLFCVFADFAEYFAAILRRIADALGARCAVEGFTRCWFDAQSVCGKEASDADGAPNLCAFVHLLAEHNRLSFVQRTVALFPTHRRALLDALVDVRSTRRGESALSIAVRLRHGAMVEWMLSALWNEHASPAVMASIVHSDFARGAGSILSACIERKLCGALRLLCRLNAEKPQSPILAPQDALLIAMLVNRTMRDGDV